MAITVRRTHLMAATGVLVFALGGFIAGISLVSGSNAPPRTTLAPASANSPVLAVGHWIGRTPPIIFFSVDAGNVASNLTWPIWTQTKAVGHGTWNYLSCVPNCAEGTSTPYPVTITLDRPVRGQFTRLVEHTTGPHGFTETFKAPHLADGACSENNLTTCGF